ncbi:MAG: Beta-galactosidase [Ferruginibacter sp.]|nr:Beta-galactosidase [Ferruginibacter sp.]
MRGIYILSICVLLGNTLAAQVRTVNDFNDDWKFYLGEDSIANTATYNDQNWRIVNLPHDWSIELPFSEKAPATTQGGALPGGIGWYRKIFSVPLSLKNTNSLIEFEGVYRNSEVWINGHFLGKRPNGYISFRYELTPWLKFGKEPNTLAVRVDNSQQPNSRWYTGSGIYRNVWLVSENKVAFDYQGNFINTSIATGGNGEEIIGSNVKQPKISGQVNISVGLHNKTLQPQNVVVIHTMYDAAGKKVFTGKPLNCRLDTGSSVVRQQTVTLHNPKLWSPDHPYLYKVVSTIFQNNIAVDKIVTITGIRNCRFDREKGFFLNNQPLKIKGVCMHHDLGALGAAFNKAAAKRQLLILKEMGCNAIRTAHNPPAPEFLELCDEMGFLVMEEAFDMWKKKKNKFDYSIDFAAWHKTDLEDMVKRDRNHPSIFMWSIGNEIREQFDSIGIDITKELVSIVKKMDATRPVTAALTETDTHKNFIYQANALDVTGWNYNEQLYPSFLKNYPGQKFIASETTSAIATRGQYDMPSDSVRIWPAKGEKEFRNGNAGFTVSAYDNAKAYWGSTHEATWKIIKKYDFLSGMFVWTGFDYLGEPTPYPWPARSSYFGIVDLAGFPKDVYYMYQSEWSSKPVLHIFPHWNWEKGKTVDVWAYYNNADEVELFLNGQSLGVRKKEGDELHVMWRVNFERGTLKAISRKDGKLVLVKQINTAGAPARIRLTADRQVINASENDLSFVTVQVLDKSGNLVPVADNLVNFEIAGNGSIAGVDNGAQTSMEPFKARTHKAFNGLCLAIIQSGNKAGKITLTASSKGLQSAVITIETE